VAVRGAAGDHRHGHEVLGRLGLPKGSIKTQQLDKRKVKPPVPSWFDLERPLSDGNGGDGRNGG